MLKGLGKRRLMMMVLLLVSLPVLLIGLSTVGSTDGTSTIRPVNLLIAWDTSGSVAGDKWEAIRAASYRLMDNLEPGDRVALLHFDTYAYVLTSEPIKIRGAEEKTKIREVFDSLTPDGQWTFFNGLFEAIELYEAEHGPFSTILLTDGLSDPGPGRTTDDEPGQKANQEIPMDGVLIYVLGEDEQLPQVLEARSDSGAQLEGSGSVLSIPVEKNDQLVELLRQNTKVMQSSFEEEEEATRPVPGVEAKSSAPNATDGDRTEGPSLMRSILNEAKEGSLAFWQWMRDHSRLFVALGIVAALIPAGTVLSRRWRQAVEELEKEIGDLELEEDLDDQIFLHIKVDGMQYRYEIWEREWQPIGPNEEIPVPELDKMIAEVRGIEDSRVQLNPLTFGIRVNSNELDPEQVATLMPGDVIRYQDLQMTVELGEHDDRPEEEPSADEEV
ncbi:MAG: VWA domain-containing protein [Candidatus Bipolaricaulia bacterium]